MLASPYETPRQKEPQAEVVLTVETVESERRKKEGNARRGEAKKAFPPHARSRNKFVRNNERRRKSEQKRTALSTLASPCGYEERNKRVPLAAASVAAMFKEPPGTL